MSGWERTILWVLLAGAAFVPIVISHAGDDHFRAPKQHLMYAVAIAVGALALIAMVLGRFDAAAARIRDLRVPLILACAAFVWGTVATLLSTHRALSIEALLWGTSLLVVFVVGTIVLGTASIGPVAVAVLFPAFVNATVILFQASRLWNPWVFDAGTPARLMKNALLGNADIVGVYLATATLFAGALALASTGWARAGAVLITLYLGIGVLASETLTSLGALGAAGMSLFVCWKLRTGSVIAAAASILSIVALLSYPPTRSRVASVVENARIGRWDHVITGRVVPFATAWQMFLDRPMTGVGPGAFKFHYMQYRMRTREHKSHLFEESAVRAINFGETHSDHLQTLAEVGLPGYVLLLAGIGLLAARSRSGRMANDVRHRMVALLAAPLAVFLLITMLAQFPLQVAASAFTVVFLAALCFAWSGEDVA